MTNRNHLTRARVALATTAFGMTAMVLGATAAPAWADKTRNWTTSGVANVYAYGSGRLHGAGEIKEYETCTVNATLGDSSADGRRVGVQLMRETAAGKSYWTYTHTGGNGTYRTFTVDINVDAQVNPHVYAREFTQDGSDTGTRINGGWVLACETNGMNN
jgi:hypothetical protein